jgi:hypothetical protein
MGAVMREQFKTHDEWAVYEMLTSEGFLWGEAVTAVSMEGWCGLADLAMELMGWDEDPGTVDWDDLANHFSTWG